MYKNLLFIETLYSFFGGGIWYPFELDRSAFPQFWLSSVSLKRVVDKGICIDVYIRNNYCF